VAKDREDPTVNVSEVNEVTNYETDIKEAKNNCKVCDTNKNITSKHFWCPQQ